MQNQKLSTDEIDKLLGYYTPKTCKYTTDVIDCLITLSKQPQTTQTKGLAKRFYNRYTVLAKKEKKNGYNAWATTTDRDRWTEATNFYSELFFGVPNAEWMAE